MLSCIVRGQHLKLQDLRHEGHFQPHAYPVFLLRDVGQVELATDFLGRLLAYIFHKVCNDNMGPLVFEPDTDVSICLRQVDAF